MQIGGIFFFLFFFIFTTYYFTSGLNQRFGTKNFLLKLNTVIFDRYLGINFLKFENYIYIAKIKIKYLIIKPRVEQLKLNVNQKTILHLEKQRKLMVDKDVNAPAFLMHNVLINYNKKKLKAKMRVKGDRAIHWLDRKTTSFKIDMRNNDRIWGLEEFSIQKPIARNYTYEYLFHRFLDQTNHLNLKYFFVNLYFNDENRGLYAVEEGFSKELLERQKKRNGPIFGLNESTSSNYPNVQYDLYSVDFWVSQYPNLIKSAFSILNNIRDNDETINIEDHFDMDRWASYFAVVDITGAYHGSISKSVKLYFNPLSAKFEPIGFDGHYGSGNFEDFILADFLQEGKINCSYLCEERNWYLKFLKLKNGDLNHAFIDKYIHYLKKYSSNSFVKNFLKANDKEIDRLNSLIYSENSKSDKVLWKGIAPFIYDDKLLYERSKLIQSRINSINLENYQLSLENNMLIFEDSFSKFPIQLTTINCKNGLKKNLYLSGNMTVNWPYDCNKILLENHNDEKKIFFLTENITMSKGKIPTLIKDFENLINHPSVDMISDNEFEISKNLNLIKNTYISKDQNFVIKGGVQLQLVNGAIFFVQGNIKFEGLNNNKILVKSDGSGSIIFHNNDVEMKYTNIENLGFPNLDEYILYGGLNFIKTNAVLEDISVKNSKSEDAINLISSSVLLKNISLENIQADAIDVDFGSLKFNKIICLDIGNDCLDISGAKTEGTKLTIDNSHDKGLSIGENSNVYIKDLLIKNSMLGVAVKDGSIVYLENIESVNNDYDLALFVKKEEYDNPNLEIKNFSKKNKKILQSKNSKLIIDNEIILGQQSNNYINSILY